MKMVSKAIDRGWGVAFQKNGIIAKMPRCPGMKYGRLYTVRSILDSAPDKHNKN